MTNEELLHSLSGMIDEKLKPINQHLEKIDAHLDAVDKRFDSMDTRLSTMDKRFDSMDTRLSTMDVRLDSMEGQLEEIKEDGKITRAGVEHLTAWANDPRQHPTLDSWELKQAN